MRDVTEQKQKGQLIVDYPEYCEDCELRYGDWCVPCNINVGEYIDFLEKYEKCLIKKM